MMISKKECFIHFIVFMISFTNLQCSADFPIREYEFADAENPDEFLYSYSGAKREYRPSNSKHVNKVLKGEKALMKDLIFDFVQKQRQHETSNMTDVVVQSLKDAWKSIKSSYGVDSSDHNTTPEIHVSFRKLIEEFLRQPEIQKLSKSKRDHVVISLKESVDNRNDIDIVEYNRVNFESNDLTNPIRQNHIKSPKIKALSEELLSKPVIKSLKKGIQELIVAAIDEVWNSLFADSAYYILNNPFSKVKMLKRAREMRSKKLAGKQKIEISIGTFIDKINLHPTVQRLQSKIRKALVDGLREILSTRLQSVMPGRTRSLVDLDEAFIELSPNGSIQGYHRIARSIASDKNLRMKRHISSKTLLGSPYETKNQAFFPVSGSFKSHGQKGPRTLIVNH